MGKIYCEYCGREIDDNKNKESIWWGVLGFFFPLVGLIIFLIWLRDRPGASKYAGLGALIKVLLRFYIIIMVVIIAFLDMFFNVDKREDRNTEDNIHQQEVYGEDDWA